jgi:hypothetical protein
MPRIIVRQKPDTICPDATVENSDATYTDTVASGGTLVLPDTDIEVNGVNEGSVPSVQTIDFQLTDGVNPVTPDSVTVVGNVVTAQVPACPPAVTRSTATLMKTGQTTSYRTGDDGDIEAGRATDFLTLDTAPLHNDGSATLNTTTNRFTDVLGGQTYTDNIVLDWSTWNGSTLLGYVKDFIALGTANRNAAVDNSLAYTTGSFPTGWRLWNRREAFNIVNDGVGVYVLNYTPFNYGTGVQIWTSTGRQDGGTNLTLLNLYGSIGVGVGTATALYYCPVRTFSLSTSNILS